MLTRFEEAGLKMKASKCHFCCSQVEYLGHLITKDGIRANPDKITAISKWEIPTTPANLHSFLGLAGYYRRLILKFAEKESPLRKALLRAGDDLKNRKGNWRLTPLEIEAFHHLKICLTSDPVIALPDFSGKSRFEVHTDASDLGISAILCQIDENNVERVIQYASRMLTKQELKWHTQEKEALAIIWGCTSKFRTYLLGSPFIIRTDHHSLKWLMRSEKGRLARWALAMSEFDYTIQHRPGKLNVHADATSRWPVEPADENWDAFPQYSTVELSNKNTNKKETLQICQITSISDHKNKKRSTDLLKAVLEAQSRNEIFKKAKESIELNNLGNIKQILKNYLPNNKTPSFEVKIIDNLLCRVTSNGGTQILVPKENTELQQYLLKMHHDYPNAGHMGRTKTYYKVLSRYFWPTIYKDTKKFVYTCETCQVHKNTTPNQFIKSLRPSLPEGPNVRISIDLIGPLPVPAKTPYKYVLVMIDYFTKWTEAVPLFSKKGEEVADALYKYWYCVYGIPFELQSDQGNEFTNDILARLNARLNIEHRVTTPYYPLANGEVERFNRTLKTSISMYAEKNPGTWEWYLNGLLWAYRTALNPSTGFTPYYLTFGREPRLPTDILTGSVKDIKYDLNQYGMKMTLDLKNAYEIVKQNLFKTAKNMKLNWENKIKSHTSFKVGEKVLLFQPQLNSLRNEDKGAHLFKRKWLGPYIVLAKAHQNNDVYILKDTNTGREWTINVNKLRKYNARQFLNELPIDQRDTPSNRDMRLDVIVPIADRPQDAVMSDHFDENIPFRGPVMAKPIADQLTNQSHRSSFRHNSGVTMTEARRNSERQNDDTKEPGIEDFNEYEVEKILNHRRYKNQLQYNVKWLGYNKPTWEPESVMYCPELLQNYWKDKPIKIVPRKYVKETNDHEDLIFSKKGEIVGVQPKYMYDCSHDNISVGV